MWSLVQLIYTEGDKNNLDISNHQLIERLSECFIEKLAL